jgi:hypothetical protein
MVPGFVLLLGLALFSAGLGSTGVASAPSPAIHQAAVVSAQNPGDVVELAPGVTFSVLATASAGQLAADPRASLLLTVDIVPIPGSSSLSSLLQDPELSDLAETISQTAPRLLFVESGAVSVTLDQSPFDISQDESIFVPATSMFEVQNTSESCATLLIFSVSAIVAGGYYHSAVDGPSFASGSSCPPPRNVITWSSTSRMPDALQLFIARLSWDPASAMMPGLPAAEFVYHPGPAALVVDEGTIVAHESFVSAAFLGSGSAMAFNAYTTYSVYYPVGDAAIAPASALAFGIVPAGSELVVKGDAYRSPTGRYALGWDYRIWRMTGSVWRPGDYYASLELSNGVSAVLFEEIAGYDGELQRCLDDAVQRLIDDPIISDVQPVELGDASGPGGNQSRFIAQFTFTRSNADGTTEEVAKHIECVALTGGGVLVINAFLPVDALETEYAALRLLLEGIAL